MNFLEIIGGILGLLLFGSFLLSYCPVLLIILIVVVVVLVMKALHIQKEKEKRQAFIKSQINNHEQKMKDKDLMKYKRKAMELGQYNISNASVNMKNNTVLDSYTIISDLFKIIYAKSQVLSGDSRSDYKGIMSTINKLCLSQKELYPFSISGKELNKDIEKSFYYDGLGKFGENFDYEFHPNGGFRVKPKKNNDEEIARQKEREYKQENEIIRRKIDKYESLLCALPQGICFTKQLICEKTKIKYEINITTEYLLNFCASILTLGCSYVDIPDREVIEFRNKLQENYTYLFDLIGRNQPISVSEEGVYLVKDGLLNCIFSFREKGLKNLNEKQILGFCMAYCKYSVNNVRITTLDDINNATNYYIGELNTSNKCTVINFTKFDKTVHVENISNDTYKYSDSETNQQSLSDW